MVNGERQLPDGWTWKTIGEVTLPIKKVDPAQKPKKQFTYLDIASIDNSLHKITEPKSYYGSDAPSRARQLVQANDVLFSTVRTYLEKIAQVPEMYDGQIASTGFSVLRANESVLPKYLFYYSITQEFLEPLNELQRGTSYPAVRDSDVRVQTIPVAPLPEQERIVAKIEELFTQLEAGTSALARVQAGLRRYKASVLKAAVEGRLGADGVRPSPEPGRTPSARTGELPEGWRWTTVGEIGEMSGGITKNSKRNALEKKLPYLRVANVYANQLNLDEILEIGVEENEVKRALLEQGDLLVVEGNGSPDQIGRVAIWNGSISPCLHQNHIIKVRFEPKEVAEYVLYWLLSESGRDHIKRSASSTSGLYTLSMSKISNLPIPLPPLEQQRRIVAEVEWRLSVARQVESSVEEALVRAARLRQAILRSAFEGKLA